ncbi:Asp23/Gls24 family envelope stress response protein [Corynebacterium confusum]|uniref:Asp23/Gls24 family envelope stress response protein n=1 Tax=Corynebacterium confusum TaxID=71254 RepID=UPI003F4954B0
MQDSASQNAPAQKVSGEEVSQRKVNSNLETEYGTTTIDDDVVAKISGIAAREVSGVSALGGGGARMLGSIRESFGASEDVRQGVSVEVSEGTAAVEVAIIAEYGVAIHELAEAIRRNIMNAVERMTGLNVDRVDVIVHDVKLPGEDHDDHEQQAIAGNQA